MLGTEASRRFARVRQFIGFPSLGFRRPPHVIADAECFDALTTGCLAYQREHGTRIEPAAEKYAQGNFGDQSKSHALFQEI